MRIVALFTRPYMLLLISIVVPIGLLSQEKIVDFDIVYENKVYGTLGITMTENQNEIHYSCETSVLADVFFKKLQIDYHYEVVYKDGVLERSEVQVDLDGKSHTETVTVKKHDGYIIHKDEDRIRVETDIPFTAIMLYFFEPKDQDICYSEQLGEFNQIKQVGEHTYVKMDLRKRGNKYVYDNGMLKCAMIDGGPIEFMLVAKE
ncbi:MULTISPECIES: DUF6134 family protein [Mangrovimonas]|uniref:DUF6134 family protein n=1 Tax=Mangrovimonas TaxID=1211036 RepID=UPI000A505AF7|nr:MULTISPECIES: DUF6134 family protein [Mangrovimonas]MCF1421167.1 hypothetical protein [Mangrovimonas futianensis]